MVSESQKEARRCGNGRTHTCENCGEEYEAYLLFVRDNFVDIANFQRRKDEYEHLCQDCNEEYFEGTLGFDN